MQPFLRNDSLKDWPDNLFDSEEESSAFLFRLKWPQGFICPDCHYRHAYVITSRRLPLYECAGCGHQTSLTAGTIMEGSRTPLTKWFLAIRLISDRSRGISAMGLRDELSVTYKTAWRMLHKIRSAIAQQEENHPLSGEVIIHDASYGKPPFYSSIAPHPNESILLAGASLTEESELAHISFQVVDTAKHVREGRLLPSAVDHFQLKHEIDPELVASCQIKRYSPRKTKRLMPLVREARKWLTQTFRGIAKKHLQLYLHEFCCRINLELAEGSVFSGISRICAQAGRMTNRNPFFL